MTAGVPRREFLKRGALAGGALAGLAGVPPLSRAASAAPIHVPSAARSVEGGLTLFAAKWETFGPVVRLTRFGPFLSDKLFNCRVAGQPRNYVLRLGTAGATLTPGLDPFRHADVVMPEDDWLGVLYGDFTGLAPVLAGTSFPRRDSANSVVLLGIVMYVAAYLPAGKNPDPDLVRRVITGLADHGLPGCRGEPPLFEDPAKELSDVVAPVASAPPVTRRLAEWVAGLRYEDLPPGTIASAKEQLKSILGAMYAGSRMPPGRKFARAVRGFGERPEATVIGRAPFRTSARHAAMLNSVYAQVLEWEDWTWLAHSGASIVPAALAAGELSRASGRDLLVAIVAGNEIVARAGDLLTDVVNTGNGLAAHQIETSLVAGKLLGLGPSQLQDAVGISCTQPQLTSVPAWTADAKGLLTGWPVLTGVEAALYAAAGITGRRDILENPLGYCYRVSDVNSARRLRLMIDGLGSFWHFDAHRDELFTKRYPTDGFQLTTVQAILDLVNHRAKAVFDRTPRARFPALVKRIEVRVPLVMAASATMFSKGGDDLYRRVGRDPDWTYIALLFDGRYPVAAALANRRLTFREYERRAISDPVIRALIDKVDLVPDLTMGVFGAEARLELADGRVFTSRQECIANFPVEEKLHIGAAGILPRRRIRAIVRAIDRLESFSDVRQFARIAGGGGRRARPRSSR